jgi:hypothetical protein
MICMTCRVVAAATRFGKAEINIFRIRLALVSQLQRSRIIIPTSNLLREIIAIFMYTGQARTATVKPWLPRTGMPTAVHGGSDGAGKSMAMHKMLLPLCSALALRSSRLRPAG